MFSIGEFAQLTGLSPKALRLYDRQGLLTPAAVDPWSNYRRYSAGQLEQAIRLRALRAADVGLDEAVRRRAEAAVVLAEHRARLAEQRRRQDAALAAASALLECERSWEARECEVAAQPWAGVGLPVSGAEEDDERANAAFAALWQALVAADNQPTGPFWSSVRAGSTEDDVELVCCWPVARAVPPDWAVAEWTVVGGVLPVGTELAARRAAAAGRFRRSTTGRGAAVRGRTARGGPGPGVAAPDRLGGGRRGGRHARRRPVDRVTSDARRTRARSRWPPTRRGVGETPVVPRSRTYRPPHAPIARSCCGCES
ncbi:MerR family DNA-binding transcriptional regulator [Saccharopolyspora thermophila]|uniref:HTH merR-type domain-containing protein n=1 Tax=Saccharopolyspora thermophila TaxID=89367 RepID=A0ABN1CPD8_9PSEU